MIVDLFDCSIRHYHILDWLLVVGFSVQAAEKTAAILHNNINNLTLARFREPRVAFVNSHNQLPFFQSMLSKIVNVK